MLTALRAYIRRARWFGGKGKAIRTISVANHLIVPTRNHPVFILLLEITYSSGGTEHYIVPLGFATGDLQAKISQESPETIIAQLRLSDQQGILYEAVASEDLHAALLEIISRGRSRKMDGGLVAARRGGRFAAILADKTLPLPSRVLKAEQSNTAIIYQDTFFLKLYRHVEEGVNPDSELLRHLTEETDFANTPAYAGSIEWQRDRGGPLSLALLLQFVPNQGDAWSFTLDSIDRSFSNALAMKSKLDKLPELPASVAPMEPDTIPTDVRDFIGSVYAEHGRPPGPADRGTPPGPDVPFPELPTSARSHFPCFTRSPYINRSAGWC